MPKITITTAFSIGQMVYLKADGEQYPRQVVSVILTPNGILYALGYDGEQSEHYEIEITDTRNVI